jgi:hypothetical protein
MLGFDTLYSDMKVLQSTWALKVTYYPDGILKKFKARFCAHGDQQHEGIDFLKRGPLWSNGPQ